MSFDLPKLKKDTWYKENSEFWKEYREKLTQIIKEEKNNRKIIKNKKNICEMYHKSGLRATARYFNISNSQVMYYVKKERILK